MDKQNFSEVGFHARLEQLEHVPSSDTPAHRPHQFIYHIRLSNHTRRPIRVTGRKWVITNQKKHTLVVEGDGVVGEFPLLDPGESFYYHSYHLIDSNSVATGAYYAEDENGEPVTAKLAPFSMEVPGL